MNSTIMNVNTYINFMFNDGRTYNLNLSNTEEHEIDTYCTSVKIKEQLYSESSNNIVGNVCCNSLSIELISNDKILISSNKLSPYYGLMNNTAMVDIVCFLPEENTTVNMGRYYVDVWENGASSSTANKVSINCVDLLSKIKNIPLGKIRLTRKLNFNTYLKMMIDSLNKKVNDNLKVKYRNEDLKIFRNSEYTWQMYYNNIDRNDLESIFNNVAQNTISYIWIDRNGFLKTDHLLDDNKNECVCNLSASTNIFDYGSQSGDIDTFSGIEVEYISKINYTDKQILYLNDYELEKGTNKIEDIQLNDDKVLNIHHIEISCEDGTAICTSFETYKSSMDMTIKSQRGTRANIVVYGTVANNKTKKITRYKDDNTKGDLISIENKILIKEEIGTYTSGLVSLMKMRNNRLYAEGYINPQVKLGDIITMQGERLGVNDYYKVVGLEFTLGTNYRCKATLLRTMEIKPDINSVLYNNIKYLNTAESGEIVDITLIKPLLEPNEKVVMQDLDKELNELIVALNGGV